MKRRDGSRRWTANPALAFIRSIDVLRLALCWRATLWLDYTVAIGTLIQGPKIPSRRVSRPCP